MKAKLALLVGGATGYVLGARDGRQRYEQLKTKAETVWQDPKIREQLDRVTAKTPAGRKAPEGRRAASESPDV